MLKVIAIVLHLLQQCRVPNRNWRQLVIKTKMHHIKDTGPGLKILVPIPFSGKYKGGAMKLTLHVVRKG